MVAGTSEKEHIVRSRDLERAVLVLTPGGRRPDDGEGGVRVRVEPDDPTGDWTREGVFEVDPGVYRIPLPLPHDGLRAVNVYAVRDSGGVVLIDSGWPIAADRERLERALAALDCGLRDIRRFLITHVHRDHYALAVALRREFGGQIALGAGEQPAIALLGRPDRRPLAEQVTLMARYGADDLAAWVHERSARTRIDPSEWEPPDVWLEDSVVPLGERTLQALPTPGHTRGHVVFIDDAAGLFFAGDHVLPHITPSIGFEAPAAPLPLANYLRSLNLVRALPDRRLLPAHGPVQPTLHARVDELLEHHARRLDECAAIVAGDSLTPYQVAQRMTWTRRQRAFADLDQFNQILAVAETAAHLDVLVTQNRLRCHEVDGVCRYSSI
jgi:glyoxylase-like metal-dependent hydrolase (beta-lactamase superfamily II)